MKHYIFYGWLRKVVSCRFSIRCVLNMLYCLLHAATLLNSTSNYCSDLLDVCVQQGTAIRFKKRVRQKDTPKTDEDEGPPGLDSSESSSSDSSDSEEREREKKKKLEKMKKKLEDQLRKKLKKKLKKKLDELKEKEEEEEEKRKSERRRRRKRKEKMKRRRKKKQKKKQRSSCLDDNGGEGDADDESDDHRPRKRQKEETDEREEEEPLAESPSSVWVWSVQYDVMKRATACDCPICARVIKEARTTTPAEASIFREHLLERILPGGKHTQNRS